MFAYQNRFYTGKLKSVMPAKAGIQANFLLLPNSSRFPKFTDEVQHFLYKVLRWDDAMDTFRLKSAVSFPDSATPGKQSAKSRQLWIARHRL
jgi:hypothetical protein